MLPDYIRRNFEVVASSEVADIGVIKVDDTYVICVTQHEMDGTMLLVPIARMLTEEEQFKIINQLPTIDKVTPSTKLKGGR